MKHVICRLPNASTSISGVPFRPHPDVDGAVITAEPVEAEVSERFRGIPGYEIVDADDSGAVKKRGGRRKSADGADAGTSSGGDSTDGEATDAQQEKDGQSPGATTDDQGGAQQGQP